MHHKVDCDLGLGAEQYKKFWSRNSIVETTSYHITVSWWGSIALWCRSLLQKRESVSHDEKEAPHLQPEAEH
jgi:hypothetical protein